ncbi:acyl-CoA dehydrogenase [Burkholderia sp. Bp8963]|uniref:acyl-CoA dehydrogenase n=1 Tax=Burkholderia sp. Bp8963 TaxID=2184547 RepID=UPI000F5A856B|nr:acyl-CoA dehydrogenase [Burkholderia sp. Bp8963]RQS64125.1 acyl-CoA dehydrogenase [Burkholderia sp. Bp8963]
MTATATPFDPRGVYLADRREQEFLLWELFDIERTLLTAAPYDRVSRADIEALLARAREHARTLEEAFYDSDRHPARRVSDDDVEIPAAYPAMWSEHLRDWFWMRHQADMSGTLRDTSPRVPHLAIQVTMEMFFGSNPSFMPYSGFTPAAAALLREHGTDLQRRRFLDKLESGEWDACLCATEREAGSDLSSIQTRATHLADDMYAISGEKILVSAGMHALTGNTLYLVLGRIDSARPSPLSLSCFIVPRYWIEDDGRVVPNHVVCAEVHDKMGLKGCANTRLVFGRDGATRGLLLGDSPNVALLQLYALMSRARIETGIFGVSLASSAYLHALGHARRRVQGTTFDKSSNPWAPKVAIIEHHDVQRMLFDMKAKVEGCRLIVARITFWASRLQQCRAALQHAADPTLRAQAERLSRLIALFGPVSKAYISEEVWHVVTQAIQVHGASGYLRERPLEQYARDLKVLSLWEGTTYIQAQDLVRDKLGFGRKRAAMLDLQEEILQVADAARSAPELTDDATALVRAWDTLDGALTTLGTLAEAGRMMQASQFMTRFMTMFGDVIVGWNLLDAANAAHRKLAALDAGSDDRPFYLGKIKSMRYFVRNILPRVDATAALLRQADHCHVDADAAEFASPVAEEFQ